MSPDAAAAAARQLAVDLARAIDTLTAAGVADESLATLKRARGLSGLSGAERLVAAGRAWRLGVLLLDRNAALYATGEVTRAIEPLRAVTNRSAEADVKREYRRAAVRGRFPTGEVVNFGYRPLALDAESLREGADLLSLDGDVVEVRWNGGPLGRRPLSDYLSDRVGLLVDGPIPG